MNFLWLRITYIFFVCFALSLPFFQVCIGGAITNRPKNITVPALIMFGDSIVDTGNNNRRKTVTKANYLPYGQDFMGGKPTGRFSNGKVPSDFIVEELGIKSNLPAYLDPSLQSQDLLTGVNFASGGNGYDPVTSRAASAISLSDQLKMFKDYITKLKKKAGDERSSTILKESLTVVITGSNDVMNTYFSTPLRQPFYNVTSYIDLLLGYASTFLQDLYLLGSRRIGVTGLPPLGCLPLQRTTMGGVERRCGDKINQFSLLFNKKLSTELNSINKRFSDARIVYIDIYDIIFDMSSNPQKYGFKIGDKGCCGTGEVEALYLCRSATVCSNVSEYVFWDVYHPTQRAYNLLVHQIIIEQNLNDFIK